MAISERESKELEAANKSGTTPVVFIHGLWLLPSSWANWAEFFKKAGYAPLTPDWPDDPETVEQARANPDVLAKKTLKEIADHTAEVIEALEKKPAVMGHSTGGLLAQILAGRGLSAATVAIDPGPFRGVLPLPVSTAQGLGADPDQSAQSRPRDHPHASTSSGTAGRTQSSRTTRRSDSTTSTTWPAPGVALMQMANANLNPWTEAKVDTKNPDRGPLLIIDGEKDHTVPWAIANASYKRQKRNPAVTEIKQIPNRGHSLTIDDGWQEVAQAALEFVKRFT